MHVENILHKSIRASLTHSLTHSLSWTVVTLTVCGGEAQRASNGRGGSLVGPYERQHGGAGWWELTVGWKRNTMNLLIGCALFPSCAANTTGHSISTVAADLSVAQNMWNNQQGSRFHLHHRWLYRGSGIHNMQLHLYLSPSHHRVDGSGRVFYRESLSLQPHI